MSQAAANGCPAPARPVSVVVVMPAYNAARTLRSTYHAIPLRQISKLILVDDASQDQTVDVAEELNVSVIRHPHNVGYGGNQKTCYMAALREGADVVIMLHPDGQYNPTMIPELIRRMARGDVDVVLGSRFLRKGGARAGGMPLYKFVANRFLSTLENIVLSLRLAEFHTGYRAYSRRFLETVPFLRNSNDFVFDQEMLFQAVAFGFGIGEIAVETRYFEGASSASFGASLIYGLKTLRTALRYLLHRAGIVRCRLFVR